MKKRYGLVCLFLCLGLTFLLSGCVQSEAAKAVDEKIAAIGEVSMDSLFDITSAERAYTDLEEKDQKQVKKYNELVKARNTYSQLKANEVIELINDIGDVTIESQPKIDAAEYRLRQLTDDERALVTNTDLLSDAKAQYDSACVEKVEALIEEAVKEPEKIDIAEREYNLLSQSLKKAVKNHFKLQQCKANLVVDAISQIGEVTLESKDIIDAAEKAYNSLAIVEKEYVTNYDTLIAAQERFSELLEEKRNSEIEALKKRMRIDADEVVGVTWFVSTSTPRYSNSRSYVMPYIGQYDSNMLIMRLVYDYAGKDWIFFKKATIVTDNYKYNREFNYFDVDRNTAFGANLCERLDILADKSDIEMLRDMATSEKTIVRLQGDSTWSDFTLSSSDKQAIADILDLYDLLSEKKETWNLIY